MNTKLISVRLLSIIAVTVYICCRHGNDSQEAVLILKQSMLQEHTPSFKVKDLIGGLSSWTDSVDQSFPKY